MLLKVVLIFLLAMLLVGMLGKLLFPGAGPRLRKDRPAVCPNCRRPLIGRGDCECRRRR
jgi:hypothetical protein